ncbi:uncharacterized protein LOC109711154 [Ananas comosus]|uniref:Uncharacterized protein LOC109711154 n=1 Tax=Ananas comosus TaxID=4615 RepID=A0A6P5F1B6_ANACO|nr:uncharacterized protein LOC109711154 [Ananas comosus]
MRLMMMGSKRCAVLFLMIILASLLSTSFAGGDRLFFAKYGREVEKKDLATKNLKQEKVVHTRILQAETNDYGSYDPPPSFNKPPFKQIPN